MSIFDTVHRKANVAVRNNTDRELVRVAIAHKYSDNYKNQCTWMNVAAGATTGADMQVDYNTGAFTTGRDWWLLTAVDEDGATYISSPHNFRDVLDWAEGALKDSLESLKKAFKEAAENPESKPKQRAAAAAGEAVAAVLDLVLNHEETKGFKQHILRSDDEGNTVHFTIRRLPSSGEASDALEISSPSGVSETNISVAKG